ncbi:alpha-amylase domain-containing protein [Spirochaeta africana]|uniref:Glycosidase n=1 Tax=Spirochaeta africana (strain ATCC 700263 / DSM 8902 / Z-7692) TaxID=889378 RepID=H9UGD5_SPIAZ|nr:alpha-amylase domain-containing protein [Spirochaeta africana]AFG36578.1 glycosidase [Spirochaeta africana DSM 8902]
MNTVKHNIHRQLWGGAWILCLILVVSAVLSCRSPVGSDPDADNGNNTGAGLTGQPTRYGTRAELEQALANLQAMGIEAYFDVVFNHRMGANDFEQIPRDDADPIYAWTVFDLPGRDRHYTAANWGELYHDFRWDWRAFNGTDYYGFASDGGDMAVRGETLFQGKAWPDTYGTPYLMGADVDYWYRLNEQGEYDPSGSSWAIRDEMKAWGEWIIGEIGFAGFRMDATAHVDNGFIAEWVDHLQNHAFPEQDLFFVAEAWVGDVGGYLDAVDEATYRDTGERGGMDTTSLYAFDFSLRDAFVDLGSGSKDMRDWDGLATVPYLDSRAVSFIDNHDTNREGNPYGTPQVINYKNQAYAWILAREWSTPTVYARDWDEFGMADTLRSLIQARRYFAYGDGVEMEPGTTGDANTEEVYAYARLGDPDIHGTGLWMLISGRDSGGVHTRWMNTGLPEGTEFVDLTGNRDGTVTANADGWAEFSVNMSEGGGWSVWVQQDYADPANPPAVPADQVNRTIYQFFYWDAYPGLWGELADSNSGLYATAADLADAGVTAVWLPPAARAFQGTNDVGYGVRDFWDLGE